MKSQNKKDNLIQLGLRLKELRKLKGFTNYEQFAYTYNLGRAQYGRYEAGQNMSLKTLYIIIEIHQITIVEFFSQGFD